MKESNEQGFFEQGFFLEINFRGEELRTGIIPEGELENTLAVLLKPSVFGGCDIIVRHT